MWMYPFSMCRNEPGVATTQSTPAGLSFSYTPLNCKPELNQLQALFHRVSGNGPQAPHPAAAVLTLKAQFASTRLLRDATHHTCAQVGSVQRGIDCMEQGDNQVHQGWLSFLGQREWPSTEFASQINLVELFIGLAFPQGEKFDPNVFWAS